MKRVPLTQGKFALISDKDWPLVRKYKWCAAFDKVRGAWYATTRQLKHRPQTFSMHRLILGFPYKRYADHRNGDGLDNQRSNLRVATGTQNRVNSKVRMDSQSGITGVYLHQDGGWVAYVGMRYLGYYRTREAAIKVRIRAAKQAYGRFARV